MSSRLEIEITSKVNDTSHTWRAVGAKEPKGTIKTSLLPKGADVGDMFRVEAEFLLDGIEIISVLPPKAKRIEPERLELIGSGKSESGVTTSLVRKKKRNDRRENKKKSGKSKAKVNEQSKRKSKKSPKKRHKSFQPPRGQRLKAKRTNRNKFLNTLPESHRPLATEVMRGSIPKLRDKLKVMDLPDGFNEPILGYAEELNRGIKAAEWLDKAEAVDKDVESVDLQDFRSVVAASSNLAKSPDAISLKDKLEAALKTRIEKEQQEWLKIIKTALDEGKVVRALNFSSRPPKAGAQLPEDVTKVLVQQASDALSSDATPERWGVVAEAVAFSPIRLKVQPKSLPANVDENLEKLLRKHSERFPAITALSKQST
ncbi:MAG: hypothetical protein VX353_07235 [Actinomycetota bacterium]